MAVSRKVDSRAVVRNRIKRVVRESFRTEHPVVVESVAGKATSERFQAPHLPHRDYVVLPAKQAATISNGQLRRSLSRHWCVLDRKLQADGAPASEQQRHVANKEN